MKHRLLIIESGTLALIGVLVFSGALAATDTITASVTVQNIAVSVSDGVIAYGTLGTNTSESTISADLNDTQTVTNDGNINEDFQVEGQDSANWTLATSNTGTDRYVHSFCNSSCSSPPTNFSALSSASFTTLTTNVASTSSTTLDLRITTPATSTVFTEQDVSVTVQATAS